ncbi:hypothetical protein CRYUN_Cryun05aG0069600 [Craigia yunnanensis]
MLLLHLGPHIETKKIGIFLSFPFSFPLLLFFLPTLSSLSLLLTPSAQPRQRPPTIFLGGFSLQFSHPLLSYPWHVTGSRKSAIFFSYGGPQAVSSGAIGLSACSMPLQAALIKDPNC